MIQKFVKLCLVYLIVFGVVAADFSPAYSQSNSLQYQQQAIKNQQAQEAARRAREQQLRQQQQRQQQLRQQEAARRAQQAQEAARRAREQQLRQKQSRDQLAKQQQESQQRNIKKKADQQRLKMQADQRRIKQEENRKKALTDQQLQSVRRLQQTRRLQAQQSPQEQKTKQVSINQERLNALKKKTANDNLRKNAANNNVISKGNAVKGSGGGQPPKPSLSKTFNKDTAQKGGAAAKPVQLSKEARDKLAGLTQGANNRAVIGKLNDLEKIGKKEHTLLKHLPNQGNPKANWEQNSSVLRKEMSKGQPIRDASVDSAGNLRDNTGFLKSERNLLKSKGWSYNPTSRTWNPPQQ